jgi:hypothetical protein
MKDFSLVIKIKIWMNMNIGGGRNYTQISGIDLNKNAIEI